MDAFDAAPEGTEHLGTSFVRVQRLTPADHAKDDVATMVTQAINLYHSILSHPKFAAFYQTTHPYFPFGSKRVGLMTEDPAVEDLCQIIRR